MTALLLGGAAEFASSPASATTLTLSISGAETGVGTSNYAYETDVEIPSSDAAPTGAVTFNDSLGGSCSTSDWTAGSPMSGYVDYTTGCTIPTVESVGTSAVASYGGTDYSIGASPEIEVAGLTLSGTPMQSATGNTYSVTFDSPSGSEPDSFVMVDDSDGDYCPTTGWTSAGSDGSGGELFAASCAVPDSEPAGLTLFAVYEGSDFAAPISNIVTVSSAPATSFLLSGSPTTSTDGNSFTVTLDAPTDLAPTGTATVSDDASTPGSCASSSWTDEGSDGAGGENFATSCSITSAETAGETVGATYVGSDYTTAASNQLSVAKADQSTLSIDQSSGTAGALLALTTSGGSGTGAVSYSVTNAGTTSCSISNTNYVLASSAGTCTVSATKASDSNYFSQTSNPTPIIFGAAPGGGGGGGGGGGSTSPVTPAPPPSGVPTASFGTPVSTTTSSTASTTLTLASGGSSDSVVIPAGALPNGTTVSEYPISNPSSLTPPAGQSYVIAFAVSWQTSDGTSPASTSPITMTINDPAIAVGDSVYLVSSSGLTLVATATVAGTVTFTFTSDPIFLVTAATPPPPKIPGAVAVGFKIKASVLGDSEQKALSRLVSKLTRGASITVTGFAKGDVSLAKLRAQRVAAFIIARVNVHVTIKTNISTAVNKVTVVTTKI
jgi:hypothetical protein